MLVVFRNDARAADSRLLLALIVAVLRDSRDSSRFRSALRLLSTALETFFCWRGVSLREARRAECIRTSSECTSAVLLTGFDGPALAFGCNRC